MSAAGELWDWRRRVAALYAAVRAEPDPAQAWRLWCETRRTLFRTHGQSPVETAVRAAYTGPHVYPYDPALRFAVALEDAAPARFDVPAGEDGVVRAAAFARTAGLRERLGEELTLYWIEGYGGGAFLPFADATSGGGTYGAGRYLLDTVKGADLGTLPDGRLVLDFNFAYAPSCAYSPRYVCPLAPPGNRLPAADRAGERVGP